MSVPLLQEGIHGKERLIPVTRSEELEEEEGLAVQRCSIGVGEATHPRRGLGSVDWSVGVAVTVVTAEACQLRVGNTVSSHSPLPEL